MLCAPPPGKFIYKFAINPATNKNKHHSNAMPCSIPTLTDPDHPHAAQGKTIHAQMPSG